jgi:hypothetical protein
MMELSWTLLPKPSHMPAFSFPFQPFAYLVALIPFALIFVVRAVLLRHQDPAKLFLMP